MRWKYAVIVFVLSLTIITSCSLTPIPTTMITVDKSRVATVTGPNLDKSKRLLLALPTEKKLPLAFKLNLDGENYTCEVSKKSKKSKLLILSCTNEDPSKSSLVFFKLQPYSEDYINGLTSYELVPLEESKPLKTKDI